MVGGGWRISIVGQRQRQSGEYCPQGAFLPLGVCNSRSVEIGFLEISGPPYEEQVSLQNLNPAPSLLVG